MRVLDPSRAAQAPGRRTRVLQRGAVIAELGIVMPILLIVMLASIDLGRLVYTNQILTDLTREAAMLVSRGGTSSDAFDATYRADSPLDIQGGGKVIITRIRRRSTTDAQPWVFSQDRSGAMALSSRVGNVGSAAQIPNLTDMAAGVTIMAVEIATPFNPIFPLYGLGIHVYPDIVYKAAYF